MSELDLATLRRFPDLEAENLFAVDASDRLILDEASTDIAAATPGTIVVLGDHYGALTLGAALLGGSGIRTFQDSLVGEQALAANAGDLPVTSLPLGAELLSGARVVLLQLPRSLSELDEWAAAIARFAAPEVVVYAGGRIKHINTAMNAVLLRHFKGLDVSLARQKSRVLSARRPIVGADAYPLSERNNDLDLTVCAHGGVFSGTKLDIGTRFLLSVLDLSLLDEPSADGVARSTAIDLGCGTGIVAAELARRRAGLSVIATDLSWAAAASATATAEANGLADRIRVVRDVGLSRQPDASADLIVLNPPFHVGATVNVGLAESLFREAARVLTPGGHLWTVYNSHLGYRPALRKIVGATREVARSTKFTVTASTKDG